MGDGWSSVVYSRPFAKCAKRMGHPELDGERLGGAMGEPP